MIRRNQNLIPPQLPQNPKETAEKAKEYAIASVMILFWLTTTFTAFSIALRIVIWIWLFMLDTIKTAS